MDVGGCAKRSFLQPHLSLIADLHHYNWQNLNYGYCIKVRLCYFYFIAPWGVSCFSIHAGWVPDVISFGDKFMAVAYDRAGASVRICQDPTSEARVSHDQIATYIYSNCGQLTLACIIVIINRTDTTIALVQYNH